MKARINIAVVLLLFFGVTANAAEVRVLSSDGMRPIFNDLGPKFEHATGHKLTVTFGSGAVIAKRLEQGDTPDVVIVPMARVDRLVKDGKVSADDTFVLARSGIGLAVRKGAPKPDISSPEALKRALLAARAITYGDPASGSTSGAHVAKVLERLGISDEMKSKTTFGTGGSGPGALVASGQAEIGIQSLQLFAPVAGVDIVGPLPDTLQDAIVFSIAIMRGARDVTASRALIDFLRTSDSSAILRANGLEPALR